MNDQPKRCRQCGSTHLDGPHGLVWFCDGCGVSIDASGCPVRQLATVLMGPSSWTKAADVGLPSTKVRA